MAKVTLIRRNKTDSQVDWLTAKFREHLHLNDPGALHLLMGAVAANLLEGEPVWLMLVGPPGSGKSELLNSMIGISGMFESANISDVSAFLSATPKKEISKEATGGILRQVGDHGAVLINDFTSILSLDKKTMDKILGVFRECYSGRWTRDVGAEGGRKLHWEGKVAFFAGVTGEIDRHHQINSSLGERWLYFRMPEDDAFERSKRALRNSAGSNWRENIRNAVTAFLAGIGLEFGSLEKRRELTDKEMLRVICMGSVGAKCRSAVSRDSFTKEIIGARETEFETRMVTALGQLLIGMETVGVPEQERWRLLGKVALDSMPALRRLAIEGVKRSGKDGVTYDELTESMRCSRSVVVRTVEDLEVHGILTHEGNSKPGARVKLTPWMAMEMKKGWG